MNLHIESSGQGPDLVLIPGWAMHASLLEPLQKALAGGFRVHLLDLPGHGRNLEFAMPESAAEFVASVEQQLPENAIWLGWSLGGVLASLAAAKPGLKARGLVLLASSPVFVQKENWPWAMSKDTLQMFESNLDTNRTATIERFLALEVHGMNNSRKILQDLQTSLHEFPQATAVALKNGLHWLKKTDHRQLLAELDIPVLLAGGRKDRIVPPEALENTLPVLKNGHLLLLKHESHAPFLSSSGTIAKSITDLFGAGP